tara:strand:+ start:1218 stop:1436 length:219 start_codon:yes stop_codon:yes gene_type:complete
MIPWLQVYVVAIGVALAAVWQAIRVIGARARTDAELKHTRRRIEAMKTADKIADDVDSDPHLADRAQDWLRK